MTGKLIWQHQLLKWPLLSPLFYGFAFPCTSPQLHKHGGDWFSTSGDQVTWSLCVGRFTLGESSTFTHMLRTCMAQISNYHLSWPMSQFGFVCTLLSRKNLLPGVFHPCSCPLQHSFIGMIEEKEIRYEERNRSTSVSCLLLFHSTVSFFGGTPACHGHNFFTETQINEDQCRSTKEKCHRSIPRFACLFVEMHEGKIA